MSGLMAFIPMLLDKIIMDGRRKLTEVRPTLDIAGNCLIT